MFLLYNLGGGGGGIVSHYSIFSAPSPQPQVRDTKPLGTHTHTLLSYLYRQSATVETPPSDYDRQVSFFIEDM